MPGVSWTQVFFKSNVSPTRSCVVVAERSPKARPNISVRASLARALHLPRQKGKPNSRSSSGSCWHASAVQSASHLGWTSYSTQYTNGTTTPEEPANFLLYSGLLQCNRKSNQSLHNLPPQSSPVMPTTSSSDKCAACP